MDLQAHRSLVERRFATLATERDVPLPGSGHTRQRWHRLTAAARDDVSLARLLEGHLDAVAILAELGGPAPEPGSRWGVWAARPPGSRVTASRVDNGWRLDGTRRYCSGARACTHALVVAEADDGLRLLAIATAEPGVRPQPGSWPAVGMAASDSLDVELDAVPATPVGGPGGYLDRPGFWHGGLGVAACWYGGALGVADALAAAVAAGRDGPHQLAHLGAVDATLTGLATVLDAAAAAVDADPRDTVGRAALRAARVRWLVESGAREVLDRVGRALGAGPLSHDPAHALRVADLTVYLRQHHAEGDLEQLGRLAAPAAAQWGAAAW